MSSLPLSDNEYPYFTTTDYRVIQKRIAKPLIEIGLLFITIDAIGYYLRTYFYIYILPPLDPHQYLHILPFLIGTTTYLCCKTFIYLDNHPTTKH